MVGRTPSFDGAALDDAAATSAVTVGAGASWGAAEAVADTSALAAGAADTDTAGSGEALAAGAGESVLLQAEPRAATNEATISEEGKRARADNVERREKLIADMFPLRTTNGKRRERREPTSP